MFRMLRDRIRARRRPDDAAFSVPPVDGQRPRVLVEYPSHGTPSVVADVLERAGYDTAVCEGPGDAEGVCRLLETGQCSAVEDADIVFNGFGLGTTEHRRIVHAIRQASPSTPVVVETTALHAERHGGLLAGCVRCDTPLSSERLIAAVGEARMAVGQDTPPAGA